MKRKRIRLSAAVLLMTMLWACCGQAESVPGSGAGMPGPRDGAGETEARIVDRGTLFADLAAETDAMNAVRADLAVLEGDQMAAFAARKWQEIYLDPDFRLYLEGKDDPADLPISGKHAFVVLGYQLQDGEMTQELKDRCKAAATAARTFPESILVCTGGATGENNPEAHTEAGLMKAYLAEECGIAPERIFTDEQAMTTLDNALYAFDILKKQGIESITVVTSSYHQRRAQMLYETLAEFLRLSEDRSVSIQGNYGCEKDPPEELAKYDARIAAMQLDEMLKVLCSGKRQIEEMLVNYGAYGDKADARNAELLDQIGRFNPDAAARWRSILDLWKTVTSGPEIHEDILPDGLPDTDALCIIALGFQLQPDGTMRDELVHRLEVVLRSAEKYPNALIVCTGGGTASQDETATEAGRMAEWLIANGIAAERVIVEEQSLTTAQNAIFTFDILAERYPQVTDLAIISSDYHIATGTLLFSAEAILRAEKAGEETVRVISNAACKAPSGKLSSMFQAGALVELLGDTDTAFEIYYDTYDIHELPKVK